MWKPFNTRQFKDVNSTHEALLIHTSVRWLSKGSVSNPVSETKDEIIKFFSKVKSHEFLSYFSDKISFESPASLANIFEKLCNLKLMLQGKGRNSIQLRDNLQAFYSKLQNWCG